MVGLKTSLSIKIKISLIWNFGLELVGIYDSNILSLTNLAFKIVLECFVQNFMINHFDELD